jgi:hypothetical protein
MCHEQAERRKPEKKVRKERNTPRNRRAWGTEDMLQRLIAQTAATKKNRREVKAQAPLSTQHYRVARIRKMFLALLMMRSHWALRPSVRHHLYPHPLTH